jgi:hypothetical protein
MLHLVAIDDGNAIDYAVVPRGTPVYSSDEQVVGKVEAILDNAEERIFDGVVFVDSNGDLRFCDAPEVQRTAERGVTLTITAEAAAKLPPPEKPTPSFKADPGGGRLSRMFGRGWKKS